MDFLNPQNPTRVKVVDAKLRSDKNQQRHVRYVLSTPVASTTAWLPPFINKEVLRQAVAGGVKHVRFDGEVEHVNARFAPLPEKPARQAMMDVTINGFELRRTKDGVVLRFSFEVAYTPDVAVWTQEAFGTDVFLQCESAQLEIPATESKGGSRRKDRVMRLPAAGKGKRSAAKAEAGK